MFKNLKGFTGGSVVKKPLANSGDMGLIPDPGRSHVLEINEAHVPLTWACALGPGDTTEPLCHSSWSLCVLEPVCVCVCVCVCVYDCVQLFRTLWTVAPRSVGFSRQEHWYGLPCPSPGHLPPLRIEPTSLTSPHWQAGSLPLVPLGTPQQHNKPPQWEACTPQLESSLHSNKDPAQPEINKYNLT